MSFNSLTKQEQRIILEKNTEPPFSGKYNALSHEGVYLCRQCNQPLFSSKSKFDAGCGWPSYDDHFPGAVRRVADPDGIRTEIVCGNCGGHLGHVFEGERMTELNTRHCVNSLSLQFIAEGEPVPPVLKK